MDNKVENYFKKISKKCKISNKKENLGFTSLL